MHQPSLPLADRVALVTGARRGIGQEIALTLAEAGAHVAICDIAADTGELGSVNREIKKLGRRCLAMQADISRKAEVDRFVEKVMDEFGYIDILVNDAAVQKKGFLVEYSEEDWDWIFDTNLKGSFLCAQAVAKKMVERGKGGAIVNIASINAHRPFIQSGPYTASKVGVVSLTESLALEWGPYQIRVNAVSPGLVRTRMSEEEAEIMLQTTEKKVIDKYFAGWAAKNPLRRVGQPSDIANTVLFLVSDAASYINGQMILVDGGSRLVWG